MFSKQLIRAIQCEAMQANDIAVRWRKGSHLSVWVFRVDAATGPRLVGYGLAHRNWRRDALHRDVFTMLELHAASKGYEQVVFDLMLEIVYPVAFKRLRDEGPKKVTKPTGGLYKGAITVNAWNKKLGRKWGIGLEPEKKPTMPSGADMTRKADIVR